MPGLPPTLSRNSVKLKMSGILKSAISKETFVPDNSIYCFKRWLLDTQMTREERVIVERQTKDILAEVERRLRWVRESLDSEVFKRNGDE